MHHFVSIFRKALTFRHFEPKIAVFSICYTGRALVCDGPENSVSPPRTAPTGSGLQQHRTPALSLTFPPRSEPGSAAATGLLFSGCQSNSLQRDNLKWLSGIFLFFRCYNPKGQRSLRPHNAWTGRLKIASWACYQWLSLLTFNAKYNHTKKSRSQKKKHKKNTWHNQHGRRIFIHELFYKQSNKQLPTCLQKKNH